MKTIKFKAGEKTYNLTMTRASVKYAEAVLGFNINETETQMITSVSKLFNAAFYANHGAMPIETTDELLAGVKNDKQGLYQTLTEMYIGTINAFLGEDTSENSEKNNTWEICQ